MKSIDRLRRTKDLQIGVIDNPVGDALVTTCFSFAGDGNWRQILDSLTGLGSQVCRRRSARLRRPHESACRLPPHAAATESWRDRWTRAVRGRDADTLARAASG